MENLKFIFDRNNSQGTQECQNVLIKGDNKDVLPELASIYEGKVKCIYIDPPYNNGDSYHYYNDNASTSSWLKDMRTVLMWLILLLSKDGSIWISIDDKEMAYLKVEADRIFKRENFAGTIVWQQRKTRENRAVFSCNHEYILVYAKDLKSFKKTRNLLPVSEKFIDDKYKNPDDDPRGMWQSVSASVQAGHAVPSQFYTITAPSGREFEPPKGRCWAYNKERMAREIAAGNIWFGLDGNNAPRIKKFLDGATVGLTPETIWAGDCYGTTDSAKKHLLSLFPEIEQVFDTPKPEELLKRIFEIASNEGELILDCYVGSGTTVSAAHKMNRRYIGIEIGDQMSDLVVKRMNKVVGGEQGGISQSVGWMGGGEFAYYDFDKNRITEEKVLQKSIRKLKSETIHQLNLFQVFDQYADGPIVENHILREDSVATGKNYYADWSIDSSRNCLIGFVKSDNSEPFLNQEANIYYTGNKFPSTVALNKLYYFIPYLKGKGIRDLYLIKNARVGIRNEGQIGEDKNDIRLVFELEFVKQLFDEYLPAKLQIWRTFTDTTLFQVLSKSLKITW